MTTFHEDMQKQAGLLALTDAERARIRAGVLGAPQAEPVASPYRFSFSFAHLSYVRGAAAFALLFVVTGTGSTLYAAEGALPGDFLYPLKTNVAEPLSGALALSDEAQARWHEDVATERLAEAEALAEKGRLTDEVGNSLALSFAKHASALEQEEALAGAQADIAPDAPERQERAGGYAVREEAKNRFRAIVAAKSASILDASGKGAAAEGRLASANFVLSVLADEPDGDAPQDPATDARVAKQAAPEALTMMAVSAPAADDATTSTFMAKAAPEAGLEELAADAKRAFDDARDTVTRNAPPTAAARLSAVLRLLVKADAEVVTGNAEAARAHYGAVIRDSSSIQALYGVMPPEEGQDDSMRGPDVDDGGNESGSNGDEWGRHRSIWD